MHNLQINLSNHLPADPTPYIYQVQARPGENRQALFGYRIPHLPDFLADHTLLGYNDGEKVAEILNRWTQLVMGLHKWRESAFSLRFTAHPQRGTIEVALVGRISEQRGRLANAELMAADLAAQLTSLGFSYQPLSESDLRHVLFPFRDTRWWIVEIRQHEELTPLLIVPNRYVIHPFWAPAGSWLLPFEVLLRQPAATAISVYLEPTELVQNERNYLIETARIGQTAADLHRTTHHEESINRLRDPQAEVVGRICATLMIRLVEPFLLTIQVASPDSSVAWTVARSLGAAVTTGRDTLAVEDSEAKLPTGFDIRRPDTSREDAAARSCFAHLVWSPWGYQFAPPGMERLACLVSAKGAATAFRFPISVRGGVPGIAVRQNPPDFEPGPRPMTAAADELHLGDFRRGGAVTIKLQDLTRHALITGFTGAGKTNTVLYLLDQLQRHRVPFLVIEAAKKEYRGLLNLSDFTQDLLVFTLGDETISPFRLNPFEVLPEMRLEAHLGHLQTCFDAALPQFGILPSIIAESLESIYRDKQWKLTDRGDESQERIFPTMRDMLFKVVQVTEERGYAGETYHNIRAAAAGRIGSLLRGSKGLMFSCQRSIPMDLLMTRPVVLELNDLNQQDKALTMMFLLMLLREYRELHRSETLQHITVVEEAHNVMENVQSIGPSEVAADTRAKAVEAFAAMLAEVRAYGEGIIISDQSPEKLAPDAIRNTNLQIAHQLRHRDDREAIAAAMIMDEAQRDYLGKLEPGEAAIFFTGYDRATFMKVPDYKKTARFQEVVDQIVADHMASFKDSHTSSYLPFDGCRFCTHQCDYRETIEPYTRDKELVEQLRTSLERFDSHPQPTHWAENWLNVVTVCVKAGQTAGRLKNVDAAWCYLAHEIDFHFTEHMRRQFERAFERVERDIRRSG